MNDRKRRALERQLAPLRREYRDLMRGDWLPTGLQCTEDCDHPKLCVSHEYRVRAAEPVVRQAEAIKAQLASLDPEPVLEGELFARVGDSWVYA